MTQDALHLLERKVDILTRLAEVSTALNSTIKLKQLLSILMDVATEITDAEAASVLLWDSDTNELRFAASTTADMDISLVGTPVPLEGSIAGAILRENRLIAVNNVERDPKHYRKVDEDMAFVTRSILGVPMRSKNRVIGVLEAVNKRSQSWTEDDGRYLTVLAAQAAVAIEGARLVSALQKTNDELSQLDKLKNDFIAIASHELRTPLGVILGYATFLQEAQDTEVQALAKKVVDSAVHLRRIIEDLTNLRYLEQNAAELNRDVVSVDAFLRDELKEVQPLADAKGHHVQYAPPEGMPYVWIDQARLNMALFNLLNNAVRFTPQGGYIAVTTEVHGDEVWLMVRDSGIGIDGDNLERVFDKFVQVEDHMTRSNGGLGIGLSIARALVEAHGGRLWAQSDGLNQGATFTMALPLHQPAASTTQPLHD